MPLPGDEVSRQAPGLVHDFAPDAFILAMQFSSTE